MSLSVSPRRERERLRALLASEVRLVTVHGLAGVGCSTLVREAVGERATLVRARDVKQRAGRDAVLARLTREAQRGGLVWVDDVHEPRAVVPFVRELLRRTQVRVVSAARGPLELPDEHLVPVSLADPDVVRAVLDRELERLGAVLDHDASTQLASAIDGWLPLVVPVARSVAAVGAAATLARAEHWAGDDDDARMRLRATWRATSPDARSLLATLAFATSALDAEAVTHWNQSAKGAVPKLVERGLLVRHEQRVRVPRPIAAYVEQRLSARRASAARRALATLVLSVAEPAAARHRYEPARALAILRSLATDLERIAMSTDAEFAARAVLALEPLLAGELQGDRVLSLQERVLANAQRLGRAIRNRIALGLARTLIARGAHESAERWLLTIRDRKRGSKRPSREQLRRDVYIAHLAAWRNELARADTILDRVDAVLATAPDPALSEDVLAQRMLVAFAQRDVTHLARLSRRASSSASPRVASVARRYAAEVELLRGRPARAAALFSRCADELAAQGDEAAALYLRSRFVEALRAAGQRKRAEAEAFRGRTLAAQAAEDALELAFVEGASSRSRIEDLSWRVQIPAVRDRAEAWLRRNRHREEPTLRLDEHHRTAQLARRAFSFARRPTLHRVLRALADHHPRGTHLDVRALFSAGWPGDRARFESQRKRVQTAVWTLRKALLGTLLETSEAGYRLSPRLRIDVNQM